jgi:hypothetical protein
MHQPLYGTTNKMQLWLRDYERRRVRDNKEPNESWAQSKFGPQNMDWRTAQQIYLPSLNLTVGQAWHGLKKLWKSYKISGRNGESRTLTAYEINRYQVALDLPRSDLPELEGIVSDYEFEEEEVQEQEQDLTADEIQQLKREDVEAEQDWWISDD